MLVNESMDYRSPTRSIEFNNMNVKQRALILIEKRNAKIPKKEKEEENQSLNIIGCDETHEVISRTKSAGKFLPLWMLDGAAKRREEWQRELARERSSNTKP